MKTIAQMIASSSQYCISRERAYCFPRAKPCFSGDRADKGGALPQAVASASRGGASDAQLPDMPLRSDTQAVRLITSIPLIQRRESVLLVKKKAPSRSGFPLSTHVVLKTRYLNPNIHVRRFIVHARSPNLSATRP